MQQAEIAQGIAFPFAVAEITRHLEAGLEVLARRAEPALARVEIAQVAEDPGLPMPIAEVARNRQPAR